METLTKTRWTKADDQLFRIRERAMSAVNAEAKRCNVLLGAGLEIQISWQAVAIAFEASDRRIFAVSDAIAYDAVTATGHVLNSDGWQHLCEVLAGALTSAAQRMADADAKNMSISNRRLWRQIKAKSANIHVAGK